MPRREQRPTSNGASILRRMGGNEQRSLSGSAAAVLFRAPSEVHNVRRVRAGNSNVQEAVAIQIRDPEAVNRTLRITKMPLDEPSARTIVEIDSRLSFYVADDDVGFAIAVQVTNRECV